MLGPNNQNIDHYYDLMQEAGGAEISYTGPGWTGHVAFVEPDAPAFAGSLEEFKQMGARVCTLSPFTLAQNSMHGSFGMSGDLAAVPPMAATVGPKEVIAAKHRWEVAAIGVHGTTTSWQRMIARLCYHAPLHRNSLLPFISNCEPTATLASPLPPISNPIGTKVIEWLLRRICGFDSAPTTASCFATVI